jgi:hypothetical protein
MPALTTSPRRPCTPRNSARLVLAALACCVLAGLTATRAQDGGAADFPAGWRRAAPVALPIAGRVEVFRATSPDDAALVFVSAPFDAAALENAYRIVLEQMLGRARTIQDLGTTQQPLGPRRTRVVDGRYAWPDGRSARLIGEVQTYRTAQGARVAGFLVRQDRDAETAALEAAAQWAAALTQRPRIAVAPNAASGPFRPDAGAARMTTTHPKPDATVAAVPPPVPPVLPKGLPAPVPAQRRLLLPGGPDAWRKAVWGGGRPDSVSIGAEGLQVAMPAGSRGAAGIRSAGSIVRLGDLAGGATTTLTFHFDQASTNGFLIGLCPSNSDGCISEPGVSLLWRPEAGRPSGANLLRLSLDGKHRLIPISATSPSVVTLKLSKMGVEISGDGITPTQDAWPILRSFLAFSIVIQGLPNDEQTPATIALREIVLDETGTSGAVASVPAAGVPPLPEKPAFPDSSGWAPYARAGGEAGFLQPSASGLNVEVPAGRSWGWSGLASTTPLMDVPQKAEFAPRRLRIAVDPAKTTSFVVALTEARAPGDPWGASAVWLHVKSDLTGATSVTLSNCASSVRNFTMTAPKGWDGRLDLTIAPGAVEAGLDERWRIAGYSACIMTGVKYHVAIFASAPVENQAARLALTSVVVDRVSPPAMTAADRFELVDETDFDPKAFLRALEEAQRKSGGER